MKQLMLNFSDIKQIVKLVFGNNRVPHIRVIVGNFNDSWIRNFPYIITRFYPDLQMSLRGYYNNAEDAARMYLDDLKYKRPEENG